MEREAAMEREVAMEREPFRRAVPRLMSLG
jgi:hypothetical protein